MKINPLSLVTNNFPKINFRASNPDDEYVYVPLIWDEDKSDIYESSDNKKTIYQNTELNNASGVESNSTKPSKFKRYAKGAAGVVGTATLVPPGIEKVVKTVENTVTSTKDSINNTVDSISEIKQHAKAVFHKEQPQDISDTSNSLSVNSEPHEQITLAGANPGDTHNDFDHHYIGDSDSDFGSDSEFEDDEFDDGTDIYDGAY